jgi:hypothetical protein
MASKIAKSYTVDAEIARYVTSTKRGRSASQRVNELLKLGIKREQYELLEREAEAFFPSESDHTEMRAFQKEARRTLERD